MVADLVDGVAVNARRVPGGPDVSLAQAEWAGPDALYAMADPDGWWNLHRVGLSNGEVTGVLPMPEECAGALWRLGVTWFVRAGEDVVLRHGVGAQQLACGIPGRASCAISPRDGPTSAGRSGPMSSAPWSSAGRSEPTGVLDVPLDGGQPSRLTPAPAEDPYRSMPEQRTADGVHYPPRNPAASAPPGSKPPLIVTVHGGPTGHTDSTPSTELSLFTSRGFAVASVDYRDSTG